MKYDVKRLSDLKGGYTTQVSKIFIDSFGHMFKEFSEDTKALQECFEKSLITSMIYVALDNDKVVGFIAVSTNKRRVLDFNTKVFVKNFGKIRGNIFCVQLNMIMGKPAVKNDNECYIDFVAVHKEYRNKGVATILFNYVHENETYDEYNLDVLSKNENAIKLYEKLGYEVVKVKKNLITNLNRLGDMVIMKYSTNNT